MSLGLGCGGHCTSPLQDPAPTQSICSHVGSDAVREGKEEIGKLRQRIISTEKFMVQENFSILTAPRALAGSVGVPACGSVCSSARGTGPGQRGVGLVFWGMCVSGRDMNLLRRCSCALDHFRTGLCAILPQG